MYKQILIPQLKADEGVRPFPYEDTKGILTIGVGRNLRDVGLKPDEIEHLLSNDVAVAELVVRAYVPGFDMLSDIRQAVLVNMAFNLGGRFKEFQRMLAAVNAKDFTEASRQMMDSKWAVEVGARALRLSYSMRTDKIGG